MTVGELKELLEGADPEAQVRLATQPNYPLEARVSGLAFSEDLEEAPEQPTVWVLEGSSMGYASKELWEIQTLG
jgi:hypothetical protein